MFIGRADGRTPRILLVPPLFSLWHLPIRARWTSQQADIQFCPPKICRRAKRYIRRVEGFSENIYGSKREGEKRQF